MKSLFRAALVAMTAFCLMIPASFAADDVGNKDGKAGGPTEKVNMESKSGKNDKPGTEGKDAKNEEGSKNNKKAPSDLDS